MSRRKYEESRLAVRIEIHELDISWLNYLDKRLEKARFRENMRDIGDKCAARILLVDAGTIAAWAKKIIKPDPAEWHGINKLERDGEL